MKPCIDCGIELNDENWYLSYKKKSIYICKKCQSKRLRKYYPLHKEIWKEHYEKHKEEYKERSKKWRRNNIISTGRNEYIITKKKRSYPLDERCELCKNEGISKRLYYHHWNDDKLELGIWVDSKCHGLIEAIDKFGKVKSEELIKKYEEFVKRLESQLMY